MSVSLDFGLLARLYFHSLHYEKFPDGTVKYIEDEIPFELPKGWEWARINNIAFFQGGYAYKSNRYVASSNNLIIRIGNVKNNTLLTDVAPVFIDDQYAEETTNYKLKECDILFTMTGTKGKRDYFYSCIIEKSDIIKKSIFLNQRVGCLRIIDPDTVNPYLFLSFIQSTFVLDSIFSTETGNVNQGNIGSTATLNLLIPIPPIEEQNRIINCISTVNKLIDIIESDKDDLQTTIQLTKSKILDLAIRGKLVPQNPDDEPASVLLDRIRAEKEELIKQGKIKRDKKESVIYKGDDNSYYGDIPDNWEVASISQLNYYQSSSVNPLLFPDEYFELFSVPNYDIGIPEIVKGNEIGSTKQSVESKDVLLCKINPRINRVWTVTCVTEYKTIASSEWIVFRNPFLYSPYVTIYLSSPLFRELLLTNVSGVGGSLMRAQPDSVKKYPVVIPPYEEQKRIADKVSQLFSLLDSIAENVN